MKGRPIVLFSVLFFSVYVSHSQGAKPETNYKHFVGTSLWQIANLFPNPPDFYEVYYGYRFSRKHALNLRAVTWKYDAPLGIPYGPSFESPDEKYPGYVRAFGIGAGYQHYIAKGLFTSIHAIPFLQNFYDMDNEKLQRGFQLFTQVQAGYRKELFRNRFYAEGFIACNYWPINTNFPESFLQKENKWPNYFCFEPHFNIGLNF